MILGIVVGVVALLHLLLALLLGRNKLVKAFTRSRLGIAPGKPSIEMKRMRKEEPSYARMPFRGSDINQGVQVSASSSLLWKPRTCVGSSYEPIRL